MAQRSTNPKPPAKAKKSLKTRPVVIRFFRMFIGGEQPPERVLDLDTLHKRLEALKYDADVPDSRYYKNADGDEFVGISSVISGRLRLRIAKKTPSPHYEMMGVFRVADAPGENTRWIAPSYCVFFPDKNIVGAIFSNEGPRMFQICRYLEDGAKYGGVLTAQELARPNVREELDRLESVNRFVVRYRASQTPSLFAAGREDIDSVLKSYADLNEDAEITVNVRSKIKGGGPLRGVKQIIANTFKDETPNIDVERFVVYGPDRYSKKKSRPVDLLLSKIRAAVDVEVEEQGSQLVQEAAFRAIEESYAEHLTQFPSISVVGGTEKDDAME